MSDRAVILGVPILIGGALVLAGLAWLVAIMTTSGEAEGEEITVKLSSDCANTALAHRLEDWGLPATFEGTTVRFRGPGQPDDATHMPEALLTPGVLAVFSDGAPFPVVVRHAGVQISLQGTPVTLMTLDKAPGGIVTATIDGQDVHVEAVNGGELQLRATAVESRAAVRLATDRTVWLRWPLPCAVQAVPGS